MGLGFFFPKSWCHIIIYTVKFVAKTEELVLTKFVMNLMLLKVSLVILIMKFRIMPSENP